jgi:chromosome segregation ATPase
MYNNEQSNYTLLYLKRQEQIMFDNIKKAIDLEIQLSMSVGVIEEYKNKYEESQKQVASQNDIMQQATRSIEDLTVKNKNFENHVKNLEAQVHSLTSGKTDTERSKNELQIELNNQLTRAGNFERELARQQQEMQSIFNESVELRKRIEELEFENDKLIRSTKKQIINKKQTAQVVTDDSIF